MGVVQQTDFDLRRKLRGSNLKVNMSLIPRPKQPPHRLSHARTRRYVSEPSTPPGRKARIGSGGLERREKPTFDPQFMSPFWATPVPSRRTNMPHRQTRPAPKRTGALSRPKPVVQQSPLLRLSGELRNEIYRYVLLERDPIMVTSTGKIKQLQHRRRLWNARRSTSRPFRTVLTCLLSRLQHQRRSPRFLQTDP